MRDIQVVCVRNNAAFCDRICRSHGVPGAFSQSMWIQQQRGPAFYPNVVTLTRDGVAEQTARIAALRTQNPAIAVKDSFATLDLSGIGMRPLFEAEWLWIEPAPSPDIAGEPEHWNKVGTATDLAHWQAAWRGNAPPLASPVFLPDLLDDPSIAILAGWHGANIVAGCVLNRDDSGIAGLSNVFATDAGRDHTIAAAVDWAREWVPGAMLVGYESGDDLPPMQARGFRCAGPLRVWV